MKPRMIDFYLQFADQCASLSRAKRLQVGAVIVKDDNIIAFSWNGTPRGWDNACEVELQDVHGRQSVTLPCVIHAEMNCLHKLARSTESGVGATMFCTHAPCVPCAMGIIQTGIKEVYYANDYRDRDGVKALKDSGIAVYKQFEECVQ